MDQSIFKAYDVRGVYPTEFNEDISYKVAQAYTKLWHPKTVVLGRDVREHGEPLFNAALKGFTDAGVNVIDIGVVSTDEFYFAVGELPVDGGITISASHNPREYNGMNICKAGAVPISSETGLLDIRDSILKDNSKLEAETRGSVEKKDVSVDFVKSCVSFVDYDQIKPTKIVANGNFGVDVLLLKKAIEVFNLPITIVPLNDQPDGTFPKGPPNPLLPENRKEFLELIKKENADLGVSWDADGDRCFFADENGNFIEGYNIIAILAPELLKKNPGSAIVIDARIIWAATEAIEKAGGRVVFCKPGMTIIADKMKKEDAIFGGELTSHFYFKENYFRDNGLIPLFLMLEMMSKYNTTPSKLALPFTSKYFAPPETNFETEKKDEVMKALEEKFSDGNVDHFDGLSVSYDDWRFNIRKSNTEPLLRLNLEARSKELMEEKHTEMVELIKSLG